MKNFILLLFAFSLSFGFAQNANTVTTMTGSGDTLVNAGTDSVVYSVKHYYKSVSFQARVNKISGTVAGTVKFYGTVDGTNYFQLSTDTIALANQATNTKIWVIDGSPYKKYKIVFVGSGTMSARIYGFLYGSLGSESGIFETFTHSGDTVTNTATKTNDFQPKYGYQTVTIQPIVTKLSGTAAGTVTLQGSNDGTNYVTVNTSYISGGSATMTVTDQTTNTRVFIITGNPYRYYRTSYTGSGTMSCKIKTYAWFQK